MTLVISPTKKRNYDFLYHKEFVVVDQSDTLLMHNQDHLEQTFKHRNLIHKDQHGCDFVCLQNWYLHNNGEYL